MAGHGWRHESVQKKTFRHKVHSAILSRNDAEHLSITSEEIRSIITRCFLWFKNVGLRSPRLYVPPAWAIGMIEQDALDELPFRIYELLTGVYDSESSFLYRLPLVGYEVNTRIKTVALQVSNLMNRSLAFCLRMPLRIAIHPFDLRLKLASDLKDILKQPRCFMTYDDLSPGSCGYG